jgi:hypothetical protein
MKAPGIHCYVAGSILAVTPRYCTEKIEKCSLEHKKNKGKNKVELKAHVQVGLYCSVIRDISFSSSRNH